MQNSRKRAPVGANGHITVSQITVKGGRRLLTEGREVRITDRNRDNRFKRCRLARPRYEAALSRFGMDAVVYEYTLNFPAHLDVLDHDDAATMWQMLEALAPDAFAKLEDTRSTSRFPEKPHSHFFTTVLLPPMPGLWRHPSPLDLHDMAPSTDENRTLFGFFCYTAKPVLGGAERPGPQDMARFTRQELAAHELAAQERTDAATVTARSKGFKGLPVCSGWVTGGRKRGKKRAA